ncbi:ankyrin repeat domain protein [Trichonephila inaurata madagascariensis]|uniref:Ankyrin repeat domain protein n=1 Tax=Trichonephila inaurata madagascariensis TaxID=2747483 RepID=A0A8X6Y557_9ARAC|nr:ankyrin repeat domain protein [Trichonephila inaurata madagascariensis]
MEWNLFGGLIPPTANHTEEKKRRHSGDSGNESQEETGVNNSDTESSAVTTLEFQLTQSLLSQVKAGENNEDVKSGEVAYKDLHRMNFVINGQEIDRNFINKLYAGLIKNDKGKKNYRLFAKYVFTKMFKHAKAEVPDDSILEELVTNCNQAGYLVFLAIKMHNILIGYKLSLNDSDKKTMYIDYSYENCVRINYTSSMVVRNLNDLEKKICELDSSLEFTLQSRDSKVKYEDGKITLTIPEQLEDYKADGKNLLDDIKMRFEDADNAIIESLVENIGKGPKSFVVDLPAEVDSDSFDIVPENAVFDLGHISELVKKAVDDKDVNALSDHICIVQARVTHASPKEGLSVVEKTLEIVSGFIEEQGKAWNCHPTVPIASHIYSAKQQYYDGYISQGDYEKVENLKKTLCKIKSDLIKRSSNDHNAGSPVINAKDTSAILNETPTSSQAVGREDNNQLNIQKDPKFKSTDSQQVIDKAQNEYNDDGFTPLEPV